jgi:hypothetical protein
MDNGPAAAGGGGGGGGDGGGAGGVGGGGDGDGDAAADAAAVLQATRRATEMLVYLLKANEVEIFLASCTAAGWTKIEHIFGDLKLPHKDFPKSLTALFTLYKEFPWLAPAAANAGAALVGGKVVCQTCNGSSATGGWLTFAAHVLRGHLATKKHSKAVEVAADAGFRQPTLLEVGGVMVGGLKQTGSLHNEATIGGLLVLGYRPYQIAGTAGLMFNAIRLMRGMPKAEKTVMEWAEGAVVRVKGLITEQLKGVRVSIAIDGGTTQLARGSKIIGVYAVSPALDYDVMLAAVALPRHETAADQVTIIKDVAAQYKLESKNILYVVADNASVNSATVDSLRTEGWPVALARCVPHTLALVLKAGIDVWDGAFGITAHLKSIRAYFKNSSGRARLLLQYGLTLSGMDFVETRWTSVIRAVKYLVGMQSPRELVKARQALTEAAQFGDAIAAGSLAQDDVARPRWMVLYECVEECGRAGDQARADSILDYNVTLVNVVAWMMLARWLKQVPVVMSNLQAGGGFAQGLAAPGGAAGAGPAGGGGGAPAGGGVALFDIGRSVGEFVDVTIAMAKHPEHLKAELTPVVNEHLKGVYALLFELNEVNSADVPDAILEAIPAAFDKVLDTLNESATVMEGCPAMEKLRTTIDAHKNSTRFLRKYHPPVHVAAPADLGFPPPTNAVVFAAQITAVSAWNDYVKTFENVPVSADLMTPVRAYQHWATQLDMSAAGTGMAVLAEHALSCVCRPASSVSVERLFSIMNKIDVPDRRSMDASSLITHLFLRANSSKVFDLVSKSLRSKGLVDQSVQGRAAATVRAADARAVPGAAAGHGAAAADDEAAHGAGFDDDGGDDDDDDDDEEEESYHSDSSGGGRGWFGGGGAGGADVGDGDGDGGAGGGRAAGKRRRR